MAHDHNKSSVCMKVQLDTSPVSETEVVREISFLKCHKTAAPNGSLLSFFKNGGEVWTSKLKKSEIILGKERDSEELV